MHLFVQQYMTLLFNREASGNYEERWTNISFFARRLTVFMSLTFGYYIDVSDLTRRPR